MPPEMALTLAIIANLTEVVQRAAEQDRDVTPEERRDARRRAEDAHNRLQNTD